MCRTPVQKKRIRREQYLTMVQSASLLRLCVESLCVFTRFVLMLAESGDHRIMIKRRRSVLDAGESEDRGRRSNMPAVAIEDSAFLG